MPDPVIELYKQGVDRTQLRESLKRSPLERFLRFDQFMQEIMELHEAGKQHRRKQQQGSSKDPQDDKR